MNLDHAFGQRELPRLRVVRVGGEDGRVNKIPQRTAADALAPKPELFPIIDAGEFLQHDRRPFRFQFQRNRRRCVPIDRGVGEVAICERIYRRAIAPAAISGRLTNASGADGRGKGGRARQEPDDGGAALLQSAAAPPPSFEEPGRTRAPVRRQAALRRRAG